MISVACQRTLKDIQAQPHSYCQPLSRLKQIHYFWKGVDQRRWIRAQESWSSGQLLDSLWYMPKEKGKDDWY